MGVSTVAIGVLPTYASIGIAAPLLLALCRFGQGQCSPPARSAPASLAIGLSLMGLTYGPLGTVLSELFPTTVRYTGSSLTFNLAGIFGASLAPYAATWLATKFGLLYVGYYLTASALLTIAGLLAIPETRDQELHYAATFTAKSFNRRDRDQEVSIIRMKTKNFS